MSLITSFVDPSELLDRTYVGSRRITVDDYPLFFKEDPIEVLELYIVDCLATSVPLVALSHKEIPYHPIDMYSLKRKRKHKSFGE